MFLVVKEFYESIYLLAFKINDIVIILSYFVSSIFLGTICFLVQSRLSSTSVLDDYSVNKLYTVSTYQLAETAIWPQWSISQN